MGSASYLLPRGEGEGNGLGLFPSPSGRGGRQWARPLPLSLGERGKAMGSASSPLPQGEGEGVRDNGLGLFPSPSGKGERGEGQRPRCGTSQPSSAASVPTPAPNPCDGPPT